MKEKAPFFFLFMATIVGALLSSLVQTKEIAIFLCAISVALFFFLNVKKVILILAIFLMGFVWLEMPSDFPHGKFFLVGNVRSVSTDVVKLSHVRFHWKGKWIRGKDLYLFLNRYTNNDKPLRIQNTFMALVENANGRIKTDESFWLSFNGPLEKLYAYGSKVSDFLYKEMKKYLFCESDTISSIFLGRKDTSYEIRQTYKDGGYAHIFSVSGMHVGFLAFVTLLFLSEFIPWNTLKYPMTFFVVLFYGFITGFSIPTLRAVSVFGLWSLLKILDRPQHLLNVLGLVGLCEVLFDPSIVFDVSFQLSYSATIAIALFFPILPKFHPKFLSESLNITIAANIGVIPFLILHYSKIYLFSFVFNVTIVPLLVMVLLEGAFLFSISALLGFHLVERVFGAGIYPFAKILDGVANLTKKMPLSTVSVESVAFFWITLSIVVLLSCWVMIFPLKPDTLDKYRRSSVDDPKF